MQLERQYLVKEIDGYSLVGTKSSHYWCGVISVDASHTTDPVPLYRAWSVSQLDHFYTIDKIEFDNSLIDGFYVDEGIEAYVYANMSIFCGQPESFYNVINGTESSDYLVGTNNPDLMLGYYKNLNYFLIVFLFQ